MPISGARESGLGAANAGVSARAAAAVPATMHRAQLATCEGPSACEWCHAAPVPQNRHAMTRSEERSKLKHRDGARRNVR